ncbi:MAG: hypothetical protein AVDCRST_MAG18-3929 [uncultured Thermomicrobiales bacterium]|uniref:Uncharacterized protein n=1 Tax=uncultured Thermomicrobiales bacterium TaxID=1645740 RepID=A0A6J4VSL7_9BACT|nr:MAG: hypothetical protein AVDCRST_MAG18-3929 [uncultured Thermomicrobiales bacterium]
MLLTLAASPVAGALVVFAALTPWPVPLIALVLVARVVVASSPPRASK